MAEDELEEKLVQLYDQSIDRLTKVIQKKRSCGSPAVYERILLRQIKDELKNLRSDSEEIVFEMVEKQFEDSMEEIDKLEDKVEKETEKAEKEAEEKVGQTTFSRLDKEQIRLIVSNTNADLSKAIKKIGRRTQDIVRKAAIEASAEKLTEGQTVREMAKNLEARLKTENIATVTYAGGKKITIQNYAKMVSRTTTTEAQNAAKVVQGQRYGYDLVRFTVHFPTCRLCAMYQGRVFALTKEAADGKYVDSNGNVMKFPMLYETALKKGYETIHPNCRHRLSVLPAGAYTTAEMQKFSADSTKPFEDSRSEKERKAYAAEQVEKRQRIQNLKQYEKWKSVLGTDCPKSFAAFVRMKKAKSARYAEFAREYRKRCGNAP